MPEQPARESDEELYLPPEDRCVHCGLPEAAHTGWRNGGPGHDFRVPDPWPRPERVANSHIQTDWTCTQCGADNDVWGVADREWMECSTCGRYSFLIC